MKTTATAVVVALLSFVIGNIWVFLSEMFVQYFYEARMVALTHVFTLGWVSLMIIGVLRQLATVAFGLKLKTPGDLQIVVFVCLLLGLAVSSAGVLLEEVFVFRLGWAMWLAGIIGLGSEFTA